jgi:DNA-binding PadR family transcriptional regulator
VARSNESTVLLGEWACLGVLYQAPAHGFAVAARLRPDADIGRVWSVSRALTYRALEQLTGRGYIEEHSVEKGIAGGERTVVRPTRVGRAAFRRWLATPVAHLRDIRSELLLKLVLAEQCGIDISVMLADQRQHVIAMREALAPQVADRTDVIATWRHESAGAALSFLDIVIGGQRG